MTYVQIHIIFPIYEKQFYQLLIPYVIDDLSRKRIRTQKGYEMPVFKYANYINKYEDPTLLNMGFLDSGLYTTTGIIPNVRYFEEQNIAYDRYPDIIDGMQAAVKKKKVKFILFYTQENKEWLETYCSYIYKDYELVFEDQHYFENASVFNAFLFKLKDLDK